MKEKKARFTIKIRFGKISAIMIAVFAVLLTLDLLLKYLEIKHNWNFTVIPKFIEVESDIQNTGAAGGLFSDKKWGRIFLIVLTFIMLICMIFAFFVLPERFVILKLAIAMITAGALGNLVDRLALGYVRDFVWMYLLVGWYCCNFADFWIVIGVILAVIDIMFLNEWAVFPLTKRAKEWAKELERKDDDVMPEEVEQPPQEIDPIPEELQEKLSTSSEEEAVEESAPDTADSDGGDK